MAEEDLNKKVFPGGLWKAVITQYTDATGLTTLDEKYFTEEMQAINFANQTTDVSKKIITNIKKVY